MACQGCQQARTELVDGIVTASPKKVVHAIVEAIIINYGKYGRVRTNQYGDSSQPQPSANSVEDRTGA